VPNLDAFGQYRIEAELGSGRFSQTYRAYDTVRRRPVALKLLHASLFDAPSAYHDFLSQASQASELVHPHIAWIWESGEDGGRFYLVERFVNGPSLANRLMQTGGLPWEQALQVTDQLAQALEFAYSRGWVHGRVTPHNILLGLDQSAILSDFGLQRALHASQVSRAEQISNYDAQYLPPEMLHGKPASPAADGYALAGALLEILAGKNPFAAPSLAEIEQAHLAALNEPLFPPENAPWQISRVLEQALSPEPNGRFQNASEFVAALRQAVRPGAISPVEQARRAAQVQAWQMAEQQSREQAEESARLAALEQARREIQEQARREVLALDALIADAPDEAENEAARPANTPRRSRRPARPRLWPALGLIAILFVALAGYGLNQWLSTGASAQPTPTAALMTPLITAPAIPSRVRATSTPVPSAPTQIFTATHANTPVSTSTRPATATKLPSLTPTSTSQATPTLLPSSTRTPVKPEKPDQRP